MLSAGALSWAASAPAPPETRVVALAFLQQWAQGDLEGAYARWAVPDFTQHNPEIPDGVAGHREFMAEMAAKSGEARGWANVTDLLLVDGDLFATLHHAFRSPQDPGRLFVDIWRVDAGHIVEHWDVIQPFPASSANRNGLACGVAEDYGSALKYPSDPTQPACGRPDPRASRDSTLSTVDAYTHELSQGEVRQAIERWFSPDYRQHSPGIADGAAGAIAHLEPEHGKAAKAHPRAVTPMRIIAEGDLVLMHRLVQYPDAERPSANIDIFRVTNGHISEHWDVKEPVPDGTRNGHGMW
jgi:predicted SnoaL-like aldol condensation-catalyzing enzyme